jgi:hypothetical protein
MFRFMPSLLLKITFFLNLTAPVSLWAAGLQSDDLGDICEMDGGSWGRTGTSWICSYASGDRIVCRPNAWRSSYVCRLQRRNVSTRPSTPSPELATPDLDHWAHALK